MRTKKNHIKTDSAPVRFLICIGVSVLVIIILSLVMAVIAGVSDDPTGMLDILSLAAMLISAVISGIFIPRYAKEGRVGYSTLVALAIVLVMLIVAVVCNGGKLPLSAFMNYGCYVGTVALSSVIFKKKGKRRR